MKLPWEPQPLFPLYFPLSLANDEILVVEPRRHPRAIALYFRLKYPKALAAVRKHWEERLVLPSSPAFSPRFPFE